MKWKDFQYKVQTTGIYYIASHVIIVGTSSNSSGVQMTLAVEYDSFIKPEKGLFAKRTIRRTTTDTLTIAGNVYLEMKCKPFHGCKGKQRSPN